MKIANVDKKTNKILGWYDSDVHGRWISPIYKDVFLDKGEDEHEKTPEKVLIRAGFYDISAIPTPNIEVSDEVWQKAININANYYNNETKEFEVKDFSTLEEKISLALSKLKRATNYEAPTVCLDIAWVGGYDSAQMLNAKRTLCLEMGLKSCTFTDSQDVDHALSLPQAKEVCIAIAAEFETRRAAYKAKKRAIELCTTIEELEAIEI